MRTSWMVVLLGVAVLAGCGDPPADRPWAAQEDESLRGSALDLPEVTQVGIDPPSTRVVVSVTRQGQLRVAGRSEALSLAALEEHLRSVAQQPELRERDGSSTVNLLLDVDRTVPWAITQWIMQTCASPNVKVYRIYFGARARQTGEDGALAAFLPKDRGLVPTPTIPLATPMRRVKLVSSPGRPTDLRLLWAALQRTSLVDRQRTTFAISTPAPDGGAVPHGYIVQVLDLLLQAGIEKVEFEGAPPPQSAHQADAAWIAAEVERLRSRQVKPLVVLDNHKLVSGGEEPPELPTGGRVDRVVGAGLPATDAGSGEGLHAEEELIEEVPGDKDVPIQEPVIKDEEIDDHVDVFTPFTGPAPGSSIGLGGGAGGAFRGRGARRLKAPSAAGHTAVDDALRWLVAHQSPNGAWEAAGFPKWCDGKPIKDVAHMPDGAGKALYDVGVTGLALNAFLAAGYTNQGKHPFAKVVSRGMRFLKNAQDAEGCFGPRSSQQYIYNHGVAALAMIEIYGMTGSPIFKGSAQRALDFTALARNPYFAWRYGIKPGDNDTSVTAWMCAVLKSAQLINAEAVKRGRPAPLTIDESAFDGVNAWLDKVTDPATGRVGYVTRGTGPARPQEVVDRFPGALSESMTAAAVFCRILMGEDPRTSERLKRGIALIAACRPVWDEAGGTIDLYYWYYGALAMFQAGGKDWQTWKTGLQKAVVETQRKDTDYCAYKGSWDPVGPWGADGGRIYATALMALTLQVAHRYDRAR